MRFVFIQTHAGMFHITTMCRVLEVSKAGYYAWRGRPLCERVKADRVLYARIQRVHDAARGRYGRPRVYQALRQLGCRCGEKRVGRLMREHGLRAKQRRRFRVTTQSAHESPIVRAHAMSGHAQINSEEELLNDPLALRMVIDVLWERGFHVTVDIHRVEVPERINPETWEITCRTKKVFQIEVRYPPSDIRRGH